MAKTWSFVSVNLSDAKDRISLTIQEGVDDIPTPDRLFTSDSYARTMTGVKAKIFNSLKTKILATRAKEIKEAQLAGLVDLTNFETFINS